MKTNYFKNEAPHFSVAMNTLALAGVCVVLLMAFFWQLAYNEVPCPLCLLQRAAFVLIGIGLLLNVRFGPSPLHYGMILLASMGGAFAAGRQVLLHIAPGDAGYGSPFLGLHFYTWAAVLFVAFMLYCAIMLMLDRRRADQAIPLRGNRLTSGIVWLFLILVAGNLVSTLLECGFGSCPDDPIGYMWLSFNAK